MIVAQNTKTKGCPYCSRNILIPGESFADIHPDYLEEYSPDNTIDPYTVFPNNPTSVNWRCKNNENHHWTATFALRHAGLGKCPVCTRSTPILGENTFADVYPELVPLWSPNNEKTPQNTFFDASIGVKWICPTCNQQYGAPIDSVVSNENPCPYCSDRKALPGFNSLADKYPEIAKLWSPNNEKPADHILPTLGALAAWICPDCHGEYNAPIDEMVAGTCDCPYCNDRRVLPGFNSLADKYPEIAKQWSPHNDKLADHVLPTIGVLAAWVCPDCHGKYNAPINGVVTGTYTCPYCNNRRLLTGFNSLADKYPEIANLWSPRNDKPADHVLPTIGVLAAWICPDCHGEYNAPIDEMVAGTYDCPYCNDRRALPGFNSLAAKYPNLLQEWSYLNNYLIADPDQILPNNSSTLVWWCCPNNQTHIYAMTPARRLMFQKRKQESCLYCKGRRRKKLHFV